MTDMHLLARAVYHWLRLWYYSKALEYVGHEHPDASLISLCCIQSQQVVDEFLNAREAR